MFISKKVFSSYKSNQKSLQGSVVLSLRESVRLKAVRYTFGNSIVAEPAKESYMDSGAILITGAKKSIYLSIYWLALVVLN